MRVQDWTAAIVEFKGLMFRAFAKTLARAIIYTELIKSYFRVKGLL